jgi:ABC-type polysaccharide/polyol phosphate transport system ATPase subunit
MTGPGTPIVVSGVGKRFRSSGAKRATTIKDLIVHGLLGREGRGRRGAFWALRGLSFTVGHGRMLGIVGSNGSGKSTLLRMLAGIVTPTEGSVAVDGRVSALIELGAGFHPELTGRENIFINGVILGLRPEEIRERFDGIVEFAGIAPFIDSPVKTYSSGMYMRLGFSIAVNVEPDVLLVDEILAVGDENFQHKCLAKISEFRSAGKTIVFVSHDLGTVARHCDEVLWIDRGEPRAHGAPREVIDAYLEQVGEEEDGRLAQEHRRGLVEKLEGEGRWGGREAEITSVTLHDASGGERFVFPSGGTCDIRIAWRSRERINDPVFGIGIFRGDGLCCYATNTDLDGVACTALEGEGVVTVRLEDLALIDGEYLLDVAVHSKDGYPYDYQSRLYRFAIRSSRRDSGVARIRHSWNP